MQLKLNSKYASDFEVLLRESAALHDHLCPRQVLGVRMGMYAAALLQVPCPQQNKRLFTFIETDGCFADGVAVATGCTLGYRTLRLIDFGKIAATFVDTLTEKAMRIYPALDSRQQAGVLIPDARSHWHAQLAAYQVIPDERLFEIQYVSLSLSIVLRDGQQVEVLAFEVKTGETVLVKPGTKIPVDGQVLDGRAAVDESAITGEPLPVEKTAGDDVFAGTFTQGGLLRVQSTGVGADTTLARIIRRVEEAQEEKAATQRFIERFAHWYTPAIMALSAVAYLVSRDLELALTLLVIGCPGALVISTPVSVVAGIGRAAQRGILIKGGEYLENAGKITALALDKTGTLTEGKPRLTDVIVFTPEPAFAAAPSSGIEPKQYGHSQTGNWNALQKEVLYWAAIAESGSEHPLARPILAAQTSAPAWVSDQRIYRAKSASGRQYQAPYSLRDSGSAASGWLCAGGN